MISSSIANSLGFGSGIDTAALAHDLALDARLRAIKARQTYRQQQIKMRTNVQ